jgi:hypothetical protein
MCCGDLGGRLHPLRRKVIAPGETRIRTLLHLIDTEILDEVIGGWLRDLADAGRLDGPLTAIAIDGKWLRGVLDGQVKLFAAMLHEEKVIIGRHRIPDETTETTQVRELPENADPGGAVVTADAVNAQRDTADCIPGPEEEGGRDSAYFLFVKGSQPKLQRDTAYGEDANTGYAGNGPQAVATLRISPSASSAYQASPR